MFNSALKFGGALFFTQSSTYQNSSNCAFTNNSANISGGAIAVLNNPNIIIDFVDIRLLGNKAQYQGGAIYSDLSGKL